MTTVEEARKDHRPKQITTLFVAESAPVGGTFFYYGNGNLGRYVRRSIEQILPGDGDFLQRFRSYGWYLDDLVLAPVNQLTPAALRPAGERAEADAVVFREVYFKQVNARLRTRVVQRSELATGAERQGPLVVEEYGSSTVIGPLTSKLLSIMAFLSERLRAPSSRVCWACG